MAGAIKKKIKMKKGKDKYTLNLTFILQVDDFFMVGNFLPESGKASFQ